MLILRVQHPDSGDGPYNTRWDGQNLMGYEHGGTHNHKTPWSDIRLNGIWSGERCGCDTPEALLAWFDSWWRQMAAAGFVVVILETSKARVGEYGQTIYESGTAEVLDTLDIDMFLGLFADLPATAALVPA